MTENVISHLNRLESAGLVLPVKLQPELEYLFRHALVQETAYESILRSDRKNLHRTVGLFIEQLHADRLDELAPDLARHFLAAGEDALAYAYLIKTGDLSLKRYALEEALGAYNKAVKISTVSDRLPFSSPEQDLHVRLQRGRALELNTRYQEALDNYRDLVQLGSQRDLPHLRLAGMMATATLLSTPNPVHDPQQAESLAQEAYQLAVLLGDREAEARVNWILMLLNSRINRPVEAVEYGEKALELAHEVGQRELLAYIYNDIADPYIVNAHLDKAVDAYQQARRLWQELDNQPMLADNLSSSALLDFFYGDFSKAIESTDEAYRISCSIGNLWGQAHSRMVIGYVHQETGDYALAVHLMEEGIALGQQSGFYAPLVATRADLAYVYAYLGQIDRAFELINEALVFGDTPPFWKPWLNSDLARIHILAGNAAEAEKAINEAWEVLSETDPTGLTTPLYFVAENEFALYSGRYDFTTQKHDQWLTLRRLGFKPFFPDFLFTRAKALAADGENEQAFSTLAEARELAESIGSRRSLWPVLCEMSRIMWEAGENAQARTLSRQALEILKYISVHSQLPGIQIDFINLSHVTPLVEGARIDPSTVQKRSRSKRIPRIEG